MTLQILSTPGDQTEKLLKEAIEQAIAGAEVEVAAGGAGHFELRVKAAEFAGQSRVAQQRSRLRSNQPSHERRNGTGSCHRQDGDPGPLAARWPSAKAYAATGPHRSRLARWPSAKA